MIEILAIIILIAALSLSVWAFYIAVKELLSE
jgi:hypothetical protein